MDNVRMDNFLGSGTYYRIGRAGAVELIINN